MRTARSSSHHGTPRAGTPPGPDPPQLPPWVWAWTRSPSTSPLGVGLVTPPPSQIPLNVPLGFGPGNLQGMLGYHSPLETCCNACWDSTPPPRGQTHTCKHITLPQTSFAGGKYMLNFAHVILSGVISTNEIVEIYLFFTHIFMDIIFSLISNSLSILHGHICHRILKELLPGELVL